MEPPNPDLLPDDLKAVLHEFSEREGAALQVYTATLEAQQPPPIFHYTREDGLKGILESGTLRLTDAFQLNDPTELTHGLKLLDEALKEAADSGPSELGVFRNRMRSFVDQGGVQATAHYFVGSFSLLGDDLPQWRSYADDARGYALEFDAGELERAFAQPQGGTFNTATFPVNYDDAEIANLYRELVKLTAPLVSLPLSRAMTRETLRTYFFGLELRFTLAALHRNVFFKNPAYRSEQEYRFLQIHQAFVGAPVEAEVRQRGEETVRFRSLNWLAEAPQTLMAVIVGPALADLPGPPLKAREWLDAAGLKDVPVRRSARPYRTF
jgi:Protein of unknown function (DUF2971)